MKEKNRSRGNYTAPAWFDIWFERYYYLLTKINKFTGNFVKDRQGKLLPIPNLVLDGFVRFPIEYGIYKFISDVRQYSLFERQYHIIGQENI
jgi:hypothetical protein